MTTIDTPQRSREWFEVRRGIPTASRFDKILTAVTAKPSSSQDALIDELIAESVLPPDEGLIPRFVSPEMEEGMRLEAEARCAYELEYAKAPVTEVGFVIHDSGLFGGSPDALVGKDGGVEIKCPLAKTHVGYVRAGVLPPEYKLQVHGYMVVTGRAYWDFFSYSRHFPSFHIRTKRDAFTAILGNALASFCARYNAERAKFNLPPIGNQS